MLARLTISYVDQTTVYNVMLKLKDYEISDDGARICV